MRSSFYLDFVFSSYLTKADWLNLFRFLPLRIFDVFIVFTLWLLDFLFIWALFRYDTLERPPHENHFNVGVHHHKKVPWNVSASARMDYSPPACVVDNIAIVSNQLADYRQLPQWLVKHRDLLFEGIRSLRRDGKVHNWRWAAFMRMPRSTTATKDF